MKGTSPCLARGMVVRIGICILCRVHAPGGLDDLGRSLEQSPLSSSFWPGRQGLRVGEHITDPTNPQRFCRCSSLTRTLWTSLLRFATSSCDSESTENRGGPAGPAHGQRSSMSRSCCNTKYRSARQLRKRVEMPTVPAGVVEV